jgi:hydroxymethylglutaryl-CoA lyase
MSRAKQVRIVEVGVRDGLQNEKQIIPTDQKIEFIQSLAQTGLKHIEVGSFVSPKAVPQMADTAEVCSKIGALDAITKSVLVPNLKGLEHALASYADEVAIFGAASETFSQKNIQCSIEESIARFEPVAKKALEQKLKLRGYVSCVFKCPWGDWTDPQKVLEVSKRLFDLGCYEISLGDTTGHGNPDRVKALLDVMLTHFEPHQLAVHFHDTYEMALTNLMPAIDYGIPTIDASAGGLGGCPYAKGASGNVATEDVVWLLNQLGIEHGVDLQALVQASQAFFTQIGKHSKSKVHEAILKTSS